MDAPLLRRAALLLLLAIPAVPAAAGDHERALELRRAGAILPLAAILDRAQAQYGGEAIEVELEEEDGAYVYEIELLGPDGVVRDYLYDAVTGTPLGEKR